MARGRLQLVIASAAVALAAAGGLASATPQDVTAEFSTTRSDITASALAARLDSAASSAVNTVVARFDASAYDSPEAAAQALSDAIAAEVQVQVANTISQSGATASVAAEALALAHIGDIVQTLLIAGYASNPSISAEMAEAAASDVSQPLANAMGAISTVVQNAAAGNVSTASTASRPGRIPGPPGFGVPSGPPTITVVVYRG